MDNQFCSENDVLNFLIDGGRVHILCLYKDEHETFVRDEFELAWNADKQAITKTQIDYPIDPDDGRESDHPVMTDFDRLPDDIRTWIRNRLDDPECEVSRIDNG